MLWTRTSSKTKTDLPLFTSPGCGTCRKPNHHTGTVLRARRLAQRTYLAALGDPIPNGAQQRLQEVLVVLVWDVVSCREHLLGKSMFQREMVADGGHRTPDGQAVTILGYSAVTPERDESKRARQSFHEAHVAKN